VNNKLNKMLATFLEKGTVNVMQGRELREGILKRVNFMRIKYSIMEGILLA